MQMFPRRESKQDFSAGVTTADWCAYGIDSSTRISLVDLFETIIRPSPGRNDQVGGGLLYVRVYMVLFERWGPWGLLRSILDTERRGYGIIKCTVDPRRYCRLLRAPQSSRP